MKFSIHIRPPALREIQSHVDYYDGISAGVADRFLEVLNLEFDRIESNPRLFEEKYRSTRVRYLKGFPIGIHYTISAHSRIDVLAVLHTSRNPNDWPKS